MYLQKDIGCQKWLDSHENCSEAHGWLFSYHRMSQINESASFNRLKIEELLRNGAFRRIWGRVEE
ncbi:MAG: hypothetical protein U0176_00270 [Bacteroidia bacterium]